MTDPTHEQEREQAHAEGEHCFCGPECDDETDPTVAHPPHSRWTVETHAPLPDLWMRGMRVAARDDAVAQLRQLNASHPTWRNGEPVARRLVRQTTTYTIEET